MAAKGKGHQPLGGEVRDVYTVSHLFVALVCVEIKTFNAVFGVVARTPGTTAAPPAPRAGRILDGFYEVLCLSNAAESKSYQPLCVKALNKYAVFHLFISSVCVCSITLNVVAGQWLVSPVSVEDASSSGKGRYFIT